MVTLFNRNGCFFNSESFSPCTKEYFAICSVESYPPCTLDLCVLWTNPLPSSIWNPQALRKFCNAKNWPHF